MEYQYIDLVRGYFILNYFFLPYFVDYGVHLTELTLSPGGPLPLRQLSSLLLKQYVDTHWSELSDKFTPPEAPPAAKAAIRNILPHGLKESISKVRPFSIYCK